MRKYDNGGHSFSFGENRDLGVSQVAAVVVPS